MAELTDIQKNYLELHESTGESFESIAARVESHNDPKLASWLRSQAAGSARAAGLEPDASGDGTDEGSGDEPKGRRAANKSVAAAEGDTGDN